MRHTTVTLRTCLLVFRRDSLQFAAVRRSSPQQQSLAAARVRKGCGRPRSAIRAARTALCAAGRPATDRTRAVGAAGAKIQLAATRRAAQVRQCEDELCHRLLGLPKLLGFGLATTTTTTTIAPLVERS